MFKYCEPTLLKELTVENNETAFGSACNKISDYEDTRLGTVQNAFPFWENIILKCYNLERTAAIETLFEACRAEALSPPEPGLCSLPAWEAFVSYFDQEFDF